jgi:hypothetical protein
MSTIEVGEIITHEFENTVVMTRSFLAVIHCCIDTLFFLAVILYYRTRR